MTYVKKKSTHIVRILQYILSKVFRKGRCWNLQKKNEVRMYYYVLNYNIHAYYFAPFKL